MIPVLYQTPEECCGCKACANVCPRDAISFKEDKYGFFFPVVNDSLCIECGRCEKVCNFRHDTVDYRREPIKGFAAVLRDKERLKQSTSGGMFWAVAEWIIKKGGCVFGCVWDADMNPVHICAESLEELAPMQGSKYVQSDVGDSYRQVKKKLEEGRYVLFTGTPCQVAALKSFLGKKVYERLFTIDLICHGVPNNMFFHQYLAVLEKQFDGKIIDFHFRHKRPNWLNGSIWANFRKGNRIFSKYFYHVESPYFNFFTPKNQSCRHSCSSCKYACPLRVGDMTIGDFWGFSKISIQLQYQGGLSCVLVNEAKVLSIIEELNLNLQEVPTESIVQGNAQLCHPYHKDEKWDYVMESSSKGGFGKLMDEYVRDNYSIIRRARIKKLLPPKWVILIKEIKKKYL